MVRDLGLSVGFSGNQMPNIEDIFFVTREDNFRLTTDVTEDIADARRSAYLDLRMYRDTICQQLLKLIGPKSTFDICFSLLDMAVTEFEGADRRRRKYRNEFSRITREYVFDPSAVSYVLA